MNFEKNPNQARRMAAKQRKLGQIARRNGEETLSSRERSELRNKLHLHNVVIETDEQEDRQDR